MEPNGSFVHEELLLWTLMRRFEAQTLQQYASHAPWLASPDKKAFVDGLSGRVPSDAPLAASELAAPVDHLLACARNEDEGTTLIVEGLILEQLGEAIYRAIETNPRVSPESRALAAAGRSASHDASAGASRRMLERFPSDEARFVRFAEASHDVLAALDAIADPVDRIFGERFGVRFAELMGDFTAELITTCTALGMSRRKVVAHLAGACMGF